MFRRLTLITCAAVLLPALAIAQAQRPEVYVQQGPDSPTCLAVSPDSRLLATGSRSVQGDVIRMFDLRAARELRTLRHFEVQALAFSPDGKWLVSVGKDEKQVVEKNTFGDFLKSVYSARLWEVASGKLVRTIATSDSSFHDVIFIPDGLFVAISGGDATKLCDVSGTAEPRVMQGKSKALRLAISPDGKTVAGETYEHAIKLWDTATGAEKHSLAAHTASINALRFGPDGKLLASGSYDKTLRLWNAETGLLIKTFNDTKAVEDVLFKNDRQNLISVSSDQVRSWNVTTGDSQNLFKEPSSGLNVAQFTPDALSLVSAGYQEIVISNLALGQPVHTFAKRGGNTCALWMLKDETSLGLVAEDFTRTKVWDYQAGEYRGMLNQTSLCNAGFGALSPDLKLIALGDQDSVALYDAITRKLVRKISTGQSYLTTVNFSFSPNSRLLAVGGMDGVTKVLDVTAGKILASINHNAPPKKIEVAPGVTVNDPASMFPNIPARLAFSPDGKILAGAVPEAKTFADLIILWDAATGRELHRLRGHDEAATALAFSLDGKQLASGDGRGIVKIWNVSTGKETLTLAGHDGSIGAMLFASDKILITGGGDGKLKLWDLSEGKELVSLVAMNGTDWLAVTPDGLFDGSPGAWPEVLWRFSSDVYDVAPVEIFFNEYFYPNLLPDILAGKHPIAATEIKAKDRRQPLTKLALQTALPAKGSPPMFVSEARDVTIRIEVAEALPDKAHAAGSGVRDVRLFRNGSLVKAWRGEVHLRDGKTILEATIPIVAGENRLSAYAFNRDNIKSDDAKLVLAGAAPLQRAGVAYVLAVGVNKYANTQYDLKYAVADAQAFATEIQTQQKSLARFERVEVSYLADREATKANIIQQLGTLAKKVQPEDLVIIFFAGHGTAQENRFYLIPHDLGYAGQRDQLDAAGLQLILSHSISDGEIEQAVEGIDAGQMLLVVDACNSGQALEAEEKRRGPMNSKGLAQLAYEKGMYILAAAQSYQAANEAQKLAHGYLTYALVEEGLKTNAADKEPKDGQVLLREWLDYATERVPEMQQQELDTQQKQGRQLDRIKFAETDSGNDRSLQRPRVFYRREMEPHPLVVARP